LAEPALSELEECETTDAGMLRDIISYYMATSQLQHQPNGKGDDESDAGLENDFSVKLRMADAMVKILKENGECHVADLARKGFAPGEIARCWDMAAALATVELTEENNDIIASSMLIA